MLTKKLVYFTLLFLWLNETIYAMEKDKTTQRKQIVLKYKHHFPSQKTIEQKRHEIATLTQQHGANITKEGMCLGIIYWRIQFPEKVPQNWDEIYALEGISGAIART